MDRRHFVISSALGAAAASGLPLPPPAHASAPSPMPDDTQTPTRKILIAGGGFDTSFIRYMAQLTGKSRPRICYLPTASADAQDGTIRFFQHCAPLTVEPFVQHSFIESLSQTQGWDEVFLSMDGIVVSGGNTLNQQAIWKAQGIDVVLRQAWEGGIVLGGASAGSLCWFEEGTTDSRPKALSIVKCLGFLPGSHSPHYDSEPGRRPLYQRLIAAGEMQPGYAVDDNAGLYFEGATLKRVVTARRGAARRRTTSPRRAGARRSGCSSRSGSGGDRAARARVTHPTARRRTRRRGAAQSTGRCFSRPSTVSARVDRTSGKSICR